MCQKENGAIRVAEKSKNVQVVDDDWKGFMRRLIPRSSKHANNK